MDQKPVILAHEKPFLIGRLEVRPATRELIFEGRSSIVEPRVMQVLTVLHHAGGAVVSKDDLIKLCWDGRVVGEDAINRVLSRLRGDAEKKGGGAFRIETITRVGYRLLAVGAEEGQGVSIPPIDRRRTLAIGGAAIATVAGSAIGWSLLRPSPMSSEAMQLHEQGWDVLREGTVDGYANAAGRFKSAVELAPDVAELWGSLALAYQLQAQYSPSAQAMVLRSKGAAAAQRALALDQGDPDAIAANVLSNQVFRNWNSFERLCRAGLDRAPRHPILNATLGGLLSQVGRTRERLPFVQRAAELEPSAPFFQMFLAYTLWDLGRIEEAEQRIERAFRLWPRHYAIWFNRYYFLTFNGRAQEALAMISDKSSRPVGIPEWNFDATAQQARAVANPEPSIVDAAVAATLGVAKRGIGLAESAVQFFGALGRVDEAFEVIEGYYFDRGFTLGEQRFSTEQAIYAARRERQTWFLFVPRLAAVRRDRRFAPLLNELGLESYWRSSGTNPDFRA